MTESSILWNKNDSNSIDPNEKLFLFGYSCKIFRDDEKARYIDQGNHLIPWMGDSSLMIDRYDVRGYLHDLKQYEPIPGGNLDEIELEEEKLCEEERYRSLRSDLTDEQLYQEEELKRLRAAIANEGAYHEIGFSYDNENQNYEPAEPKVEEPEDEPYEAPEGLVIPKGLEMPSTMKIHAIIEKTAMFVSQQGGQMEIIIKMKQHANPLFGFMHLDNPLHPYYKFLVKQIKSGSYKPVPARRVSRSEDEDDDGHYLHPSLLSGKKEDVPQFTVPSINFRRSQDDSYSVLVRNLQQQQEEEKAIREAEEKSNASKNRRTKNHSHDTQSTDSILFANNVQSELPPSEMRPIIRKMAEYVSKNGDDFEYVVKSKNDKRFEFLKATSQYFNYYMQLKNSIKAASDVQAASQSSGSSIPKLIDEPALNETAQVNNENLELKSADPTVDEFEALYSQDSQDFTLGLDAGIESEDHTSSLDSVDSFGLPKSGKTKSAKSLKGPISFSLKTKEAETPPSEKTKIPLLLNDSDEDSNGAGKERGESSNTVKSPEDTSNATQESVEREEKQKLNVEQEAKLAEELKKNKLLSAARERLLQHKKEKRLLIEQQKREEQLKKEKLLQIEQMRKERELQLERKRKAALFLKMLKKRDPEQAETLAEKLGTSKKSRSGKLWEQEKSEGILTENGILFPDTKFCIKTIDQSSSSSDESGEEIMITEFSSNPDHLSKIEPVPEKELTPVKKEHKKKKKKHSRSRSRDKRSKSSKSKDRHRSRSPRTHKHEKSKKEKELPAAYALKRSKSRSRSPRHHRQSPYSYWNRRR